MSYLLENSLVVSKKDYIENEEKYLLYQSYPIDNHLILTENEKAFFSIYDIANFCKKKYKEDKLFLIAHRYYDKLLDEKITEFYIFNTIDIFDKSLTSFLLIKSNELLDKQVVIQDNINIAKKLLNINSIHIILGDNVKEHEVVEYITGFRINSEVELFDEGLLYKSDLTDINKPFSKIKSSRISSILKSIRIIEPQSEKLKKMFFLVTIVIMALLFSEEYIDDLFDDSRAEIKKTKRVLNNDLQVSNKNLEFKLRINNSNAKEIKKLNAKEFYNPENEL